MLKVVTAKEMQTIDRTTIKKYGITGKTLMERAGIAVVKKINELYYQSPESRTQSTDRRIIILCGGGNNGGDGFVIARLLHKQGRNVRAFLSVKPQDLTGDARLKYTDAVKSNVQIFPIKKFLTGRPEKLRHGAGRSPITGHCLIVDALLGTGLNNDVRPPLTEAIKKINRLSCPVVSVDIASGISSDTGQIMGQAVKADHTVTFGLLKRGQLLYPGADNTGQLHLADIEIGRASCRERV